MTETVEIELVEMKFVCLCGQRRLTRFMQAADLFEKFKILAYQETIVVTLKPGVSEEQGVADLRNLLEAGDYIVAAIVYPERFELSWRNPDVRVVSNGQTCFMLDDWMEGMEKGQLCKQK